jgi:hypothetical protein
MTYKLPFQGGPPFFAENMSENGCYSQDHLNEIENAYFDNIDPLLRSQSYSANPSDLYTPPQKPLQRFIAEPERNYFTADSLPARSYSYLGGMSRPSLPISSLPQAPRGFSPSPSQDPTSSCTSAGSPGIENEWYSDNFYSLQDQDGYSLPNATAHLGQGVADLWSSQTQPQSYGQLPGYHCVNMSQVQGFVDPQEGTFEADEGFDEMQTRLDYAIDEIHSHKNQDSHPHYSSRYHSDEGIGSSIADATSPNTSTIHVDTHDEDADADADAEDVVVAEEASDTEYNPKSTRARKRRATNQRVTSSSPPSPKRSRNTKSIPKSKAGTFSCKSCEHAPFKDSATLQRHTAQAHTRAFLCVFDFAGCKSTFASKNEWKRHVSSQHLNLNVWVCAFQNCKNGNGTTGEFNRKDLFTQHLRRMHAPANVKRTKKTTPEWEERIKDLQTSCYVVKRHAPTKLRCCVPACGTEFEGANCWDDRMEHIGKHLEKAAGASGGRVQQGNDSLLVGWALQQGIIEPNGGVGGFRLVIAGSNNGKGASASNTTVDADDDEDAEGEDDE